MSQPIDPAPRPPEPEPVPPAPPGAPVPHQHRTEPPRWLWLTAIGAAVLWMSYLAFFGPHSLGKLPPPDLDPERRPAAGVEEWTLHDMAGQPVSFASFRGRPIFLNIWATWCGPCVEELPTIERLAADPRLKDVAFLCVSVEDDDPAKVRDFLAKRRLTLPAYTGGRAAPIAFATEGIPATFILDRSGQILISEVGSAQWDAPEVVDLLAKLAAEGR